MLPQDDQLLAKRFMAPLASKGQKRSPTNNASQRNKPSDRPKMFVASIDYDSMNQRLATTATNVGQIFGYAQIATEKRPFDLSMLIKDLNRDMQYYSITFYDLNITQTTDEPSNPIAAFGTEYLATFSDKNQLR